MDRLVIEDLTHVPHPLGPPAGPLLDRVAALLAHLLVDIDDVGDFTVLALGIGVDVVPAPAVTADHSAEKLVIGACGLSCGTAAEHRACGKRRRGTQGLLQKLSASTSDHREHSLNLRKSDRMLLLLIRC